MAEKDGSSERDGGKGQEEKKRNGAEWVTLAVSVLIVLGLAGLVIYQEVARGTDPPVIEVQPRLEEVRQEGGTYYVPVEITNKGEQTAEDVEVQMSLEIEGEEPETIAFAVKFLAGGETGEQTAAFQGNPAEGKLTHVVAFATP